MGLVNFLVAGADDTRLDGQIYSRGSADDFNNWAKVTGDAGWSWDKLQPYIKKVVAPLMEIVIHH